MARRPNKRYSEEDFDSLEGRASKTEQKKAVQRMAALGEQLAELSAKQIQKLPVDERLIDALLDAQTITSFEARRNASERHTLRQHVLRIQRDITQAVNEDELAASKLKLFNYVQQVALLSDN